MDRRTLIQALGVAPLAGVPAVRAAGDTPLPVIGAPLTLPASVALFDGGTFQASAAQGKVVLVYWWASWCPFCAVTTPFVQKLWDAQRSRGLAMLGLAVDRRAEDARKYMIQRGYTFPTGFHSPEIERVLPRPGKALPVTCVRGRDGRVALSEPGQLFEEDVAQIADFL